MIGRNRAPEQLSALFIFGALLLLPPLLIVFNQPVRVLGVPVLFLYLFLAWIAVIGFTAAVARRITGGGSSGSDASPAEQDTAKRQAPDA
jgi:hypothetical protein